MPFFIPKGDIFMVTYKLQKFIRSELFNHKTFAKSFEINSFTQNEITLPCNRETYHLYILNMIASSLEI